MSDKNDVAPDVVEDFKIRTSEYSKSAVNPDIFKLRKEVKTLKLQNRKLQNKINQADSRSNKAMGVYKLRENQVNESLGDAPTNKLQRLYDEAKHKMEKAFLKKQNELESCRLDIEELNELLSTELDSHNSVVAKIRKEHRETIATYDKKMQSKENSCRRLMMRSMVFACKLMSLKWKFAKLKLLLENKDDALEKLKNHVSSVQDTSVKEQELSEQSEKSLKDSILSLKEENRLLEDRNDALNASVSDAEKNVDDVKLSFKLQQEKNKALLKKAEQSVLESQEKIKFLRESIHEMQESTKEKTMRYIDTIEALNDKIFIQKNNISNLEKDCNDAKSLCIKLKDDYEAAVKQKAEIQINADSEKEELKRQLSEATNKSLVESRLYEQQRKEYERLMQDVKSCASRI